jgi:3-hydroxyisobutyrate dehydrogenase-like beta-hydroxyacid dehydrogenase
MNKNISFIGSGNVATFLAKAFYMANCNIKQIFSPNLVYAETLAKNVNAEVCSAIQNFNTHVDFIIIAITDSKIEEIANDVVITLGAEYIDFDNVSINDIYVIGKLIDVALDTEDYFDLLTENDENIIL